MIFVISHEIIPETHRRGFQTTATGGLLAGFVVMMILDVSLGERAAIGGRRRGHSPRRTLFGHTKSRRGAYVREMPEFPAGTFSPPAARKPIAMYALFERLRRPLRRHRGRTGRRTARRRSSAITCCHPGLLIATLAVTGIASVAELSLYAFLGIIVDWMATNNRPRRSWPNTAGHWPGWPWSPW